MYTVTGNSDVPDVGITSASFVVQIVGRFFHAHAAVEYAGVLVVFVFGLPFSASPPESRCVRRATP